MHLHVAIILLFGLLEIKNKTQYDQASEIFPQLLLWVLWLKKRQFYTQKCFRGKLKNITGGPFGLGKVSFYLRSSKCQQRLLDDF